MGIYQRLQNDETEKKLFFQATRKMVEQVNAVKKLEIELEPQSEKLLSFVVSSPGKEVVFRTKVTFYLNSPEFKF